MPAKQQLTAFSPKSRADHFRMLPTPDTVNKISDRRS